jgi:hypothetical protein
MKDMTTAEFQKTKLEALEEPVKVRRYTKAVGTYYPEGYIATLAVAVPAFEPGLLDAEVVDQAAQIVALEDEVKHLKKLLAAKMESFEALQARTGTVVVPVGSELLSQERRTVPQHPMKDVFSDLAKQDREFFERKLGKPGKTK